MLTSETYDLVICGAGLVGLTLANCLDGSQLRIAVIDSAAEPQAPSLSPVLGETPEINAGRIDSGYAPRVSAINLKSARLLDRFGIWETVQRSQSLQAMQVWDSSGTARLEFDAADIKQDRLGYIVENRELIYALASKLKTSTNVSLLWQHGLDDLDESEEGYALELENGLELNCRLLVGADGGNSRIRTLSGTRFAKWPYGQNALVTTIRTERGHGGIARQWFTEEGPLAFLPLAEPDLCSIVWSLEKTAATDGAADYLDLDEVQFCQQLSEASESGLGKVLACDARFSFPLMQQHCFRYVRPNLALIGDAAHTIHPLAGQGANLGFADAAALAQVLLQCPIEGTNPGDLSVLREYERNRQPQNLAMTSLMEVLKRLYGSQNPGLNWLRNKTMHWVDDNAAVKLLATRVASGLI